jgi:hypothetical protein
MRCYAPRNSAPRARAGGPFPPDLHDVRHLWLKGGCWLLWVLVSFVATFFARDLQTSWWGAGRWATGWPPKGAVLVFIAIVVAYAGP